MNRDATILCDKAIKAIKVKLKDKPLEFLNGFKAGVDFALNLAETHVRQALKGMEEK